MKFFKTALFLLVATGLVTGCVASREVTYKSVELIKAEAELPDHSLLDVGILLFDPGVPEDQQEPEDFVFPDVRRAEARFVPYHLKRTLEGSGLWGSVWVLPERTDAVDVLVWGRIDHSDGLDVKMQVGAWDSTGAEWLNKKYKARVAKKAYSKYRDLTVDPYQSIYNQIANDLLEIRQQKSAKDLRTIRDIAELRFAADLVPSAFGDHIEKEDGIYSVRRLPAAEDPMVQRIRAVRDREYSLVDTLNEYYGSLYYEMSPPYEDWREMSREETLNLSEMKRAARLRQLLGLAAILGAVAYEANGGSNGALTSTGVVIGVEGIVAGFRKSAEAKRRSESLRELGESFDAEAEPLLVELEGQTRRLTGTAEQKYMEWRRLLREIYSSETGFSEPVEAPGDGTQASFE